MIDTLNLAINLLTLVGLLALLVVFLRSAKPLADLVAAVGALVEKVGSMVKLVEESHRTIVYDTTRLRGDVDELKLKVEHLEAGVSDGP